MWKLYASLVLFFAFVVLTSSNQFHLFYVDVQGAALVSPTTVPLPGTLSLFASSLGVVGLLGWRRKKKAAAFLGSFIMLSTGVAAKADLYQWSFEPLQGNYMSGHGVFQTTGSEVTQIDGLWEESLYSMYSITNLSPTGSYGLNDNLLPLNSNGITFIVGAAAVNIYYNPNVGDIAILCPVYYIDVTNGTCAVLSQEEQDIGIFTYAPIAAPVPLPATLPLFATGLGALGLLGWHRKWKARLA